ncbi:MAG TPA: hypothetical protein VGN34_09750 [Ktedonobacteraceae bacterium]|jgi:hypothetical protein
MSLDYDLTGFPGAGSQMSWPATSHSQPSGSTTPHLTSPRQQTNSSRHQGHTLAASHTPAHSGVSHTGHGAGHQPAQPKKQLVTRPFDEKAF